jgi:NitT/TauT family transport system substrate-binding protein
VPRQELLDMLADPENGYSVAPEGSLRYAAFLADTGVIKAKPETWGELFLPLVRDRAGS